MPKGDAVEVEARRSDVCRRAEGGDNARAVCAERAMLSGANVWRPEGAREKGREGYDDDGQEQKGEGRSGKDKEGHDHLEDAVSTTAVTE